MESMPNLKDVFEAGSRIATALRPTPLVHDPALAARCGAASVWLKAECLQNTGSFKVRGAANRILSLTEAERRRGVIAFSTGNHGRAVSWVAGRAGIPATVCLSEHVPAYRAEAIRALGAEVSIHGRSQDEAEAHYRQLAETGGLTPVVPFDDPYVIAGQGTIAVEILSEVTDADILLVQLSGGGLLAGIAMAAKTINPGIRVVGVSLERSPAMLESLKAGAPVPVEEKDTIADSLLGGIGVDNRYTLSMIERYVDDHLLVTEEEIEAGMRHVFETHRLVVEGAGAVGVGALLARKPEVEGKTVAALLSGSSIQSSQYLRIVGTGL